GTVKFIGIEHAAAMRLKQPAYTPSSIPEGAYSGTPAIPSTDLPTVAVQRTLVANQKTGDELISFIAGILSERRQELAFAIPSQSAELRPLLAGLKPPGDSGNGLEPPVHRGAAAYYDRDKPSFVQRYADYLTLLLTIALLIGSWVWELKRW